MIDLTPLEVRKKKGDFRRVLRGYDADSVDDFLDMAADRLEELVRENLALNERVTRLEERVTDYREREKALTEALVSAQEFREERLTQASREADLRLREAESEAERILEKAMRDREREEAALRRVRARRVQLAESFRAFLEREMHQLEVESAALELNEISVEAGERINELDTPEPADAVPGPGLVAAKPVTRSTPTSTLFPEPAAPPPPAPKPAQPAPKPVAAAQPPAPAAAMPPNTTPIGGAAAKWPPPSHAPGPASPAAGGPAASPGIPGARFLPLDEPPIAGAAPEHSPYAPPERSRFAPPIATPAAPPAPAAPAAPPAAAPDRLGPAERPGLVDDGPPITGNEDWLPLLEDER